MQPGPALILLAYVAFISLGLPDAVLGVAWPSIAKSFAVQSSALGVPLAAAAGGYFASGLAAGWLARTLGIGGLLLCSTALTLLGVLGYASSAGFAVFLASACVVGFGSGAIDAALNTYAARNFAAQHMTWLHAAYSAGAAASPALMTAVLARGAPWQTGYVVIAVALACVGLAFALTRRAWSAKREVETRGGQHTPASLRTKLTQRHVLVQLVLFMIYGGIEISAGQWSYTLLTQARRVDPISAGQYVTAYWSCLLAGRVLLGFVVGRLGNVRLLRLATLSAVFAAAALALLDLPEFVAAFALALLGFSLAPIFPGLMAETPRRVGHELSAYAVGLQVSAATIGVAVLPNVAGVIAEYWGLEAIATFIAACVVALGLLHELLVRLCGD